MTTYHLLTLRQRTPVSPGRVARLARTFGPRWAIVREGEGEYGVGMDELSEELREAWEQQRRIR